MKQRTIERQLYSTLIGGIAIMMLISISITLYYSIYRQKRHVDRTIADTAAIVAHMLQVLQTLQSQGIEMAVAAGVATVDMDQIQIHPTVQADTAAEIAQTGSYSWLVVDQKMADASSVIQDYISKGYTVTGNTAEELAAAAGMDEAAFATTLETWNGYVKAGSDPEFGRTSFAEPLDTAPYYAIKVTAGVHHTMGGLVIDTSAAVLNENGEAIPGLYAAGEVTGGVHGANRLGGNAVSDFTVFGRIAGESAAAFVG